MTRSSAGSARTSRNSSIFPISSILAQGPTQGIVAGNGQAPVLDLTTCPGTETPFVWGLSTTCLITCTLTIRNLTLSMNGIRNYRSTPRQSTLRGNHDWGWNWALPWPVVAIHRPHGEPINSHFQILIPWLFLL